MFHPIENGSVYEVPDNAFGFIYKCNLPPIGYGVNSITGELEETDIIGHESEKPQHWERYTLPKDFKEKRAAEKERQSWDRYYFDPYLQEIRTREWKRRLCGVWFWNFNPHTNKNELRYITGTHYLYITYWKFQGKFMDFRINDMEAWYVVKYCETDPDCLGINEITKRKLGKTAKLGCWLYDRTSKRPTNQHAAFQSKADDDAEEVMKKAIVQPWQKLPDFFRPIYDTMKGDDPKELRFFHTSRRGSVTEEERDEEDALESWIEYGASGVAVFDGPELDSYGSDEAGKTKKPVSILERQRTVRFCAEIDGEFKHRKQYYTTTVEIEDGEEDNYEFQELTAGSNPLDRNENNRTKTGLYTYFLPAQKGMYFDIYGYPNEEKAIRFLTNERKKLEDDGDTRGLSSFKRKNPMSFKEAFSSDGTYTLYDPEKINYQIDNIQWRINQFIERGNLEWVDGFEFVIEKEMPDGTKKLVPNELRWVENPNGIYEKVKGWFPRNPNSVYENNGVFLPNDTKGGVMGADPFKYDKTKDKRRSNAATFYYQLPNSLLPSQYDEMLCIRYSRRPEGTMLANRDMLKLAWWCGCKILFERNVNHWKRDFELWKCSGFLMWMPNEVEPGIITRGGSVAPTVQVICNYTESYINKHIEKVYFLPLLRKETGWLGFKVEDTEKFDEPMAAGITLIAVHGIKRLNARIERKDIESILPYRKAI